LGRANTLYIHLTLLPHIGATGEMKTKPTQHSVRELRSIGIQPDVIVCRADYPISEDAKAKISLFCDVDQRAVIPLVTAETIYEVPLTLEEAGLAGFLCEQLGLSPQEPAMEDWRRFVEEMKRSKPPLPIGLVGKYVQLQDAYLSVREALYHAGVYHGQGVEIIWIDSEDLEKGHISKLEQVKGIVVPGGFGYRGIEGKVIAAHYAREHRLPYLGLCLGLQVMVIELVRHSLRTDEPNSAEFNPSTRHPVISLMSGQQAVSDKGGTMRLGAYPCYLVPGTKAASAYEGEPVVWERHRHRFEVNNTYREVLQKAGAAFSGFSPDGRLIEILELKDHPWMVSCQFHPEFKSRPTRAHPLFRAFIAAAGNQGQSGHSG
jgi:CTP synthase